MKAKFLSLIFFGLMPITMFAQQEKAKLDYLSDHSAVWDGAAFKSIDKVFTPDILKNQFFMIGEGHGVDFSYEVQFDLLKYLNKKAGVRYLLVELGYLDGLVLNDYLKTGNDSAYYAAFAKYNGTFYYNKSVHLLFKRIYELNRTLPKNKQIVLLPVDIEHGYRKAIAYMQTTLFTGEAAETPVAMALNKIDSEKGAGKDIAAQRVALYPAYKANINNYEQKLGGRFQDADFLLRNTYEMLNIALKNAADTRRDSVMLENFNIFKKRYHLENEKLAGFFGGFHVKQTDQPNDLRFASLLKRSNAVKGLCSALMVYNGGYMMRPKNLNDSTRNRSLYTIVPNTYDYFTGSFDDGDLLNKFGAEGKAVLFDLTANGSPFKGQKSFLMNKDQYATTDKMFQLLILINNSPATEPLTGTADK